MKPPGYTPLEAVELIVRLTVQRDAALAAQKDAEEKLADCERDHPPEPQYLAWCEAGCPDVSALERDLAAARQRIAELESLAYGRG